MKFFGVLAVALALGGAAQAKQYVVNGDFTQLSNGVGQFDPITRATGWSGGSAYSSYNFVMSSADAATPGVYNPISLWDANNGGASSWNGSAALSGNFAAMDGDFETHAISQVITGLTPGKQYQLSFWYGFGQQLGFSGATQQTITATLGNGFSWTSPTYSLPNHGFSGWSEKTATVTADSTSEVLSFLAYGNLPVPPFALVSNVSLFGAVPEPSTWAMLILGVALVGAAARRRRRGLAVAAA